MAELSSLMGFDVNNQRSVEDWALQHSDDHWLIRQRIQDQSLGNLPAWQLWPVNFRDWDAYALRHQAAHNEMNDALGLSGSDLTGVDFKDEKAVKEWNLTHFSEHEAAHSSLGI